MIELRLEKTLDTNSGRVPLRLDLLIAKGSLVAITGPSGGGKTTLLKIIAGLVRPETGQLRVDGELWVDATGGCQRPPQQRSVGMVFQDDALFPHMTVRQNLRYASDDRAFVDELLALVDLTPLAERYPQNLSGGQKQRVALARAVARRPQILLLDEPLSALDPQTRRRLQDALKTLHQRFALTTLLVSHDTAEIYRLAQRVLLLDAGQIISDGTPQATFLNRRTSHKFSFVGEVLAIEQVDTLYIATIVTGEQISEVVLTAQDVAQIAPGDTVLVGSKAFNPVVRKLTR